MKVQVLNEDLFLEGIIEEYNSLIWANRYAEQGDCELYLEANSTNLDLLRIGRFLMIDGDYMVCVIRKIEITTDVEKGNYLIVTGKDVKNFLSQRIIVKPSYSIGDGEEFIRTLVTDSVINPQISERKMVTDAGNLFRLGMDNGLTSTAVEFEIFQNVQTTIENICKANGWGYKATLGAASRNISIFDFEVFAGDDKSDTVVFTPKYKNLTSSDYVDDYTDLGNVILVEGEDGYDGDTDPAGFEYYGHYTMTAGATSSTDRWEKYKKSSVKKQISYYDLLRLWGGGDVATVGGAYFYTISLFKFPVVAGALRSWIESTTAIVGETFYTENGVLYCRIPTATIATLPSEHPASKDQCTLSDLAYLILLAEDGAKDLSKYGRVVSFDGEIIPNGIFKYRDDYNLGDIVSVTNELGVSAQVRITEAIEVWDTSGYNITLKYEHISAE